MLLRCLVIAFVTAGGANFCKCAIIGGSRYATKLLVSFMQGVKHDFQNFSQS